MSLKFLDINCRAGGSETGTYKPALSSEDLTGRTDASGIDKTLLWHIAQRESSASDGNRLLADIISDDVRLLGTWAALPPQADEQVAPEMFFNAMRQNGICALRLFPAAHRFLLNRTVMGGFLDEIAERKIPVLFSMEGNDITWKGLYDILSEYPRLVCIICDTGIWGTDRYFRPLVEAYENVCLDTSLISLGDGVMEAFVRDYGPHRLLFGTGFPERIPEASMLQLIHADMEDRQKEAIASGNGERLISEVNL